MENIYLITGDDLFEREQALNKIKEDFGNLLRGINFVTLDKDTVYLLDSEITTYPFGFDKKLIIVNIVSKAESDEPSTKSDWFTEELMKDILNTKDMNVVVFVGNFQTRSKIYKFVSQNGKCIECNNPRTKREITPWVVNIVKQNGKKISSESASYMVQVCGANKLMLYNEIQKLVDYVGDKEEILKEDIESVGIRTLETIIFDLTDSLGMRNISSSIRYLNELLAQKEPLQKILIMIARHFKSLLITKVSLKENRNLSEELNTKFPFILSKYKEQSKKFNQEELENILVDLANLDVDSKLSKIDLKIGLETVLIKNM